MFEIVKNTVARLNKNCTLDEIKRALKQECEKAKFPIGHTEWNYMFNEILYKLAQ